MMKSQVTNSSSTADAAVTSAALPAAPVAASQSVDEADLTPPTESANFIVSLREIRNGVAEIAATVALMRLDLRNFHMTFMSAVRAAGFDAPAPDGAFPRECVAEIAAPPRRWKNGLGSHYRAKIFIHGLEPLTGTLAVPDRAAPRDAEGVVRFFAVGERVRCSGRYDEERDKETGKIYRKFWTDSFQQAA